MVVDKEMPCEDYLNQHRMCRKRFYLLNPTVEYNCTVIPIGTRVCLNDGKIGCLQFYYFDPNIDKTCQDLADKIDVPLSYFKAINPFVNCDKPLQSSDSPVCNQTARFQNCSRTYLPKINETVQSICRDNQIKLEDFYEANPNIAEDGFKPGQLVCLVYVEETNLPNIIGVLKPLRRLAPSYSKAYDSYISSPNQNTLSKLEKEFEKALIVNGLFRNAVAKLEKTSEQIQKIMTKNKLNKTETCKLLKKQSVNSKIKTCFCSEKSSTIYCYTLLETELSKNTTNLKQPSEYMEMYEQSLNFTIGRRKRAFGCSLSDSDLRDFAASTLQNLAANQVFCYGGECCYGAFGLALCFGGAICKPINPTDLKGFYIELYIRICVDYLRQVLRDLKLDIIWDACVAGVTVAYYPHRGQFIGTVWAKLFFIRFSIGFEFQAYRPNSVLCQGTCEPYCITVPGKAYFTGFKVDLLLLFWWKTVYNYGDNTPAVTDCTMNPGSYFYLIFLLSLWLYLK